MLDTAWLSGFIDGEGSFNISARTVGARTDYHLQFFIELRADDAEILSVLKRTLGGVLFNYGPRSIPKKNGGEYIGKPKIRWQINAKDVIPNLIAYLDKFTLQTRKAKDYLAWREAYYIWILYGPSDNRLRLLRNKLMNDRKFKPTEVIEVDLGPEQLEFIGV